MTSSAPIRRSARPSQQGFMLVAVICLVAILTIALAVALPKISKQIQRDRELETMQRGKQYIRAIRMYYKKFGGYPANPDALIKPTNNIRFLRKKYSDPTTGKEDWKPIPVGMNKAPTVMGFFGQPLGGVGGGCGAGSPGANTLSNNQPGLSGSSSPPPGGTSSSFGSTPGTSTGGNTNCAGNGLTPSGDTSSSGNGTTPTDPNAANANGGADANAASGSTGGLTGQTFGGAGIMGFSPNSPKKSIMIYKTKDHYNQWEFVYDPIAEQLLANGPMTGGAPGTPGTGGAPGFGGTPGVGGTPGIGGNSGMGGNFGGASPAPAPTPTPTPAPSQ